MLEFMFVVSMLVLSFAVSLGVGSSTVALVNFFAAIHDGTIEPTERRMMGVTYAILRVAMVVIALALMVQYMLGYGGVATPLYGTAHATIAGLVTAVLYLNAILMTYRFMPSTFGPAIQAGSWYLLGFTMALITIGVVLPLSAMLLLYLTFVTLLVAGINGIMGIMQHQRAAQQGKK